MSDMRPIIFVLVLISCWLLQSYWPRRQQDNVDKRLLNNFGLMFSGTFLLWLIVPLGATGAALWAEQQHWGLLQHAPLPVWLSTVLCVVVLDAAIYWQHRAMHRWPLLWRLHRVHHSDLQLDASSGVRFHPLEILLSMLYKMAIVVAIGASAESVVIYEVVLSSFALFNHSNWAMPADHCLRKLIITPDVHRVHHSVTATETNSNYGNFLVVWDKLFGSYIAQPKAGHQQMQIGLEQYRDPASQKLLTLLSNPFTSSRN
jgi:sterol desaturase/sphingolipid hydroxylase (fatty acid hydroxylase superfamily)